MFAKPIFRATVIAVAAFAASTAFAADTKDLTVSATVRGICKLVSVPALSFTLNPAAGGDVTNTTDVSYRCTKGTAPSSFTVGGADSSTGYSATGTSALAGQTAGNTDVIPFSIAWSNPTTAGSGMGTGVDPVLVTLTGTILGADYVNATADTYKKTVAIVIAP